MSIRIQSDGLPGSQATETKRLDQVSGPPVRQPSDSGVTRLQSDHIEISSLGSALAAAADARSKQVHAIREIYQAGQYQVDSAKLATSMVSEALAGTL
jgi:anti-sigma28 factor (negative regulator of flagellin synthesis)